MSIYTLWKWPVLEIKLTYIKDQCPTEEICHLLLPPYGTDGFEEGVVVSETSDIRSNIQNFTDEWNNSNPFDDFVFTMLLGLLAVDSRPHELDDSSC